MSNSFCHVELQTDLPGKAKEFYSQVFNWKFEDGSSPVPGGVYTHIRGVGAEIGGGLLKKPMAEAPNAWLPYVLVDDVDATLGRARKLGATIVVEKMIVPKAGAFGVFIDPSGAALGVWERTK